MLIRNREGFVYFPVKSVVEATALGVVLATIGEAIPYATRAVRSPRGSILPGGGYHIHPRPAFRVVVRPGIFYWIPWLGA